jgi:UDP-3-O-[3-hydroxymyristoyl] N-acetylglucosamine deacetylase
MITRENSMVKDRLVGQMTIRASVIHAKGVGVHSGKIVQIALRPAPEDTGIVFRRVDFTPAIEIPALVQNVGDTTLSTCLIKNDVKISTVEHLLSAIAGFGIDNLYIDINSEELPIMDGSAAHFVFLLQAAGLRLQSKPKKFICIKKKVTVEIGEKTASLVPYEGFNISFAIDFTDRNHPDFTKDNQHEEIDFSTTSYLKEISRARTFGFLSDVEFLREQNLSLGASLDNVLVFNEKSLCNQSGKRFHNEPVRHKILDVIGDLYLLGSAMVGKFSGCRSGHAVNNALLLKLLSDKENYEYVTYTENESPISFGYDIEAEV